MKTQTIIIGQTVENQRVKKVIKFEKYLSMSLQFIDYTEEKAKTSIPKTFNYIELICKDYIYNSDLMFAYTDPNSRKNGTLFIGKWNDGVVE